jgi:hypothetical protein
MGNERRLLALDVLKGVNNESMGISVLGDDDAESRHELFVNVQHDQSLQEGGSLLSAARALTLCGLSPEASVQGGAFVRPNTSARLTEIEGTWKFVSGTGAYKDATGSGTYKFAMTSQTEFMGKWKETMKSSSR